MTSSQQGRDMNEIPLSEIPELVARTPPSGKKRSIALLAAVATFGSLLFGYDTGVISGALPYMYLPRVAGGLALNSFEEGLVGGILAIGAAFGARSSGDSCRTGMGDATTSSCSQSSSSLARWDVLSRRTSGSCIHSGSF